MDYLNLNQNVDVVRLCAAEITDMLDNMQWFKNKKMKGLLMSSWIELMWKSLNKATKLQSLIVSFKKDGEIEDLLPTTTN